MRTDWREERIDMKAHDQLYKDFWSNAIDYGRYGHFLVGGDYVSSAHPVRIGNPVPLAISTSDQIEVLRLLAPVPIASAQDQWASWGLSLGYSLLAGMQHYFMLGSGDLDFELEGPWETGEVTGRYSVLSLAFIDPSLGGSGYLGRIAEQFHRIAEQASEHLDHPDRERL